ncbi:MAG: hypothetical protein HOK52_14250 [Candidatus Marinimicrobia bacterium]|jgi:hypothetical protein|nr:hypothetical protein [Candidatus Neomarinimicrobiota bacterium]
MARLNTIELTIKVSKLQKDNEDDVELMSTEIIAQLETIIIELSGGGVLVEIDNTID